MIEALVSGKMLAPATQKTGKNKPFVLARLTANSHAEEYVTVSVIAFDEKAQEALLKLSKGDQVTVTGRATPKLWEDLKGEKHSSLDLVANNVLTVYQASEPKKSKNNLLRLIKISGSRNH